MPTVTQIIHMRRRRRNDASRTPTRRISRIALGCVTVSSLIVAVTGVWLTIGYASLTYKLPSLESIPNLLEPPDGTLLEPTRIYDRSGEILLLILENPAASDRQYLSLDDTESQHLPSTLIEATIAIADPTFWTNPGYSVEGIQEGIHPTIAQRLVFDLLLGDEPPGLRRSFRERLLAAQVISSYGREKVLEWYLNSANYGRLAYGADAAALAYFGKSATDLTLAEATLLAATAEAPALNPLDAPDVAPERQRQVLHSMLSLSFITADDFQEATQETLNIQVPIQPAINLAPVFTKLALEQLAIQFGQDRIARGGFQVLTTLDYDLQLQSTCAVNTQLSRLGGSKEENGKSTDGTPCEAGRLLPTFPHSGQDLNLQLAANVVVLNPSNGQLLAMVGESGPGHDPARLPGHSPGSLLTPFVYLTAFTRGLNPASLVWDIPASLPETLSGADNPDGNFHGPVRLRTALANDYLIPAVQVLAQMGPENVWRMARQLGMVSLVTPTSKEEAFLIPLQGGEVTLLEICQAYGVFSNQGTLTGRVLAPSSMPNESSPLQPVTVLKLIEDPGKVWLDCQDDLVNCHLQNRSVISAQLSFLLTHVLSDETARWPSLGHPNPLEIGRPVGAKIGQTSKGVDAWTVGYTPQYVVGVWIGDGSGSSSVQVPPTGAAGLWHAIIQYISRDLPAEGWSTPPGISTLEVCDPSGMLPTVECPVVVSEVFQSGREPHQTDTLYRGFHINRETGRLATVFTPLELIEKNVYIVVPPEAVSWAHQADLPIPPESYDVIDFPAPQNEEVQITFPGMFTNVNGQVAITGSAGGEGFEYYRLQMGAGLNPGTWLQIRDDIHTPVKNGQIAIWDTSDLEGLYALQLLVVAQDQTVRTTTIQVTVDNNPPQVSIRFPEEGQRFIYPLESTVTLQAVASDDLELATVEFYVDNRLVTTLTTPPFAVPWQAKLGQHTLRVQAYDHAGNVSEAALTFVVER